jgi:regulatory protein
MRHSRDISAAKRIAYQLLKFRARSEREIRDRLKQKGFAPEIIGQTIEGLYRLKYLNDREFAAAWTNSRLNKPLGIRRIRLELRQKGISEELIAETLDNIRPKYREYDTVLELARARFGKMKGIEEPKARRRVYTFLAHRGFNIDTINEVMDNL